MQNNGQNYTGCSESRCALGCSVSWSSTQA